MSRPVSFPLFRSVRGRLVLLVAAVAVPALLLATFLIIEGYRTERASIAGKLLSTARAFAAVVDGEIQESQSILKTIAASGVIERGDVTLLDAIARKALARDDRWFVLTDGDGKQLVNTRLPPGTELPATVLQEEHLQTMRRGDDYVSNLRFGPVANAMVAHVSQPYHEKMELKYTLNLAMLPAHLRRALNVERYAPGSVVTVVDRKGIIVVRSRSPELFVGKSATPDIVAATAANAEGTADSVTLEGISVLAAYSRARCGWSVVIGAPHAELYASARRLLLVGLCSAGLLVGVATLMAAWIGRALIKGVDSLTADAERMSRRLMPKHDSTGLEETDFVSQAMRTTAAALLQRGRTLEILNRVNAGLVAERDLEKIVQSVTDAGRETSGAAFGAFFYNVKNGAEDSYTLFTLSGATREEFERFGMPHPTPVFAPAFSGQGTVRVADITADPRYGKVAPHHGLLNGHPPVRSFLAVPVKSRDATVLGGLFFGHPEVGVFTQEAEDIVIGLAAEAGIAIENAKLYNTVERELEAKTKAEAELRVAQQGLERDVQERTASLREAIAQMEEFSYTVSHDLRSPLRSMSAYAGALLEDYGAQLDDQGREYVRRIQRASERMDRLTMDVLRYSRVARSETQLAPIDVEKLVWEIVEENSELQAPRVEVRIISPLQSVRAHEISLAQSLANLLTNAAKFVETGKKPQIVVRTESIAGKVRIWFEDNGIGIAPEFHAKLFKIFERAPTDGKYEGTGIGLAIVRKAVEKMGGACGVESDGRNGSRFWIELPAA